VCLTLALAASVAPTFAQAQNPAPPSPAPPEQTAPAPNSGTTLRLRVNLVTVPVVVRDSSGHALGNLQKENFQLYDERKQQQITQFTVEKAQQLDPTTAGTAPSVPTRSIIPENFTALLFDDMHSSFDNLPQLQSAAFQFITNSLNGPARLAIFTTSGKVTQDFTDDRAKLYDAVKRLRPNPLPGTQGRSCPTMSYYSANQIVNRHDTAERDAAMADVYNCGVKNPRIAETMVNDAAESTLRLFDMQTATVLQTISDVIDRLNSLPGQRTIVLASPSFLISDHQHRESQVIDRAVRAHIMINTLDSRGVLTDDNDNIADYNVLSVFADGTGGTFFHNNNNLVEGLRRVGAPPEFVYQLGFSPENLQENGKYHEIKVKIVGVDKVNVSARRGYFAPNHLADPKQQENDLVTDAIYSQSEINDLPIKLQTQTVRDEKPPSKLNVVALVTLDDLPHHQAEGKNANDLRVIAAIFDHNGKYLGAIDRKVAVRWVDAHAGTQTAATLSFLLDPGTYLVRLVVRDSESQNTWAQAATVDVP
jgi:VWFA-related protein